MKHPRLIALAAFLGFHLAFFGVAIGLSSCKSGSNQIDQKRLAEIGDLALTLAERSGQISPAEAAMAREAGKLILTPEPASPAALEAVTVTK